MKCILLQAHHLVSLYSKQSTILATKFKCAIGQDRGRWGDGEMGRGGDGERGSLINRDERQSAIISVAVTGELAVR
ncbi:MAG: hypothetical protein JGK17_27955 [Microcoleus sp. PH2017_10_PVI_O_A]|uniref:hypothetical protein n=1 Tax=unclassified Microcoleus TaxID=2642155 RepID=UPI001D52C05A|nr:MULTISPECIES: hypothetical protein [unclassified Microcoleus]MCC3544159.1 hypothetical protein [Microcoleus sp. PH2017_22_RUC_O_B]MCC3562870.1 hypothetical protein [Microcoleus sp. PH2017_27_LUM_O_A]MCC3409324.1 hypothetical protein [Microcoleus sp. PH2017_10_PVI_O_A]MCC3481895.1 hypothetical protein [Microcoleus sp. PH2017_12_PCY_D_A]MCC3527606.1 hypothetical protein [Microcoleus sp. PH2017_21_RUC_O_A]